MDDYVIMVTLWNSTGGIAEVIISDKAFKDFDSAYSFIMDDIDSYPMEKLKGSKEDAKYYIDNSQGDYCWVAILRDEEGLRYEYTIKKVELL